MADVEVKKECTPKTCKEDIVDVVLAGPDQCVSTKECGT